jgi:tRNA (cytidine/uridine-2'-O-)-methyltransferase
VSDAIVSKPPLFHVVLHQPEIPNNTGNIGRTCIATGCALHLIRPLGFDTSEKACRRAGLDYWPRLRPTEHESFEEYLRTACPPSSQPPGDAPRPWLFTTKRGRPYFDADFHAGDHLVFGKETRGLPDAILDRFPDRLVTFPMAEGERSLNLATAVCAAVYEGLRQLIARGDVQLTPQNRLDRSTIRGASVSVGPSRQTR